MWYNVPRNKISMTSALIARPRHLGLGVTDFSAQPSKKRNVDLRQEGFDPAGHSFESGRIHWPRSACWNMGIGPPLQPTCTSVVCPVQCSASDQNRKPPSQPLPRTRARAIKGATHTVPRPSGHVRVVHAKLLQTFIKYLANLGHWLLVDPRCVGDIQRSTVFERFGDRRVFMGSEGGGQSTSKAVMELPIL